MVRFGGRAGEAGGIIFLVPERRARGSGIASELSQITGVQRSNYPLPSAFDSDPNAGILLTPASSFAAWNLVADFSKNVLPAT
jgi:hypothetical protein